MGGDGWRNVERRPTIWRHDAAAVPAGLPDQSIQQIAHCLWALLAALLGGLLAATFFGGPRKRAENRRQPPRRSRLESAVRWWLWPAVLWLAGCVLILFLGSIRLKIGARILGRRDVPVSRAACSGSPSWVPRAVTDKRRQIWLGAAIFGVGYMTLAWAFPTIQDTGPVFQPTICWPPSAAGFLPASSGFPATSDGVAAANARIMAALERPVPMRFPDETPLEDILKYVQTVTTGPDGKGIPIYVDPIGLQEADKNMNSTGDY